MIPDVQCKQCSLQLVNPMTDKIQKGDSCRYPGGGNKVCRSVYHSCADVTIDGKTPREQYKCPTEPPLDWIQPAAAVPRVYTQERAAPGDWSEVGWLTAAPPKYRQDCGMCSPSKATCSAGDTDTATTTTTTITTTTTKTSTNTATAPSPAASPPPCRVMVDVRVAKDYAAGNAGCTANIPRTDFAAGKPGLGQMLALVGNDKAAAIGIHCYRGIWAGQVKVYLENEGFTNVENDGGWDNEDKDEIIAKCDNVEACINRKVTITTTAAATATTSSTKAEPVDPARTSCLNGQEGVCINVNVNSCEGAETLTGHCAGESHVRCCPTSEHTAKPTDPGLDSTKTTTVGTKRSNGNSNSNSNSSTSSDPCNTILCSMQCNDECGWSTSLNLCGTGYETSTYEAEGRFGECGGDSDDEGDKAFDAEDSTANKGNIGMVVGVSFGILAAVVGVALMYTRWSSGPRKDQGAALGNIQAPGGTNSYTNPQYEPAATGTNADATYDVLPHVSSNADYMQVGAAGDDSNA